DATAIWGTPLTSELDLRAASGVDPDRLGPALIHKLEATPPLPGGSVSIASSIGYQSSPQLVHQVEHNVDSVANTIWSVITVAGLIGLLGLGSTLTMSIISRTREIGLLLSLGARRRLLQRMVLVEAGTLLAAGLVLAIPVGAALAYLIAAATQQIVGGGVAFSYPWRILPLLVILLAVAALIGSGVPMRRVSRIDPVLALRVD
ncbi:MAG: ABC transporter permease, partial [Acidimicrobiales bacterium]